MSEPKAFASLLVLFHICIPSSSQSTCFMHLSSNLIFILSTCLVHFFCFFCFLFYFYFQMLCSYSSQFILLLFCLSIFTIYSLYSLVMVSLHFFILSYIHFFNIPSILPLHFLVSFSFYVFDFIFLFPKNYK